MFAYIFPIVCGAAVGAVLRWLFGLGAGVFCAFFYRYIGGKLAGCAADWCIGGTLNRSAMAFALDYRLSWQLDHIFRFFSGDGGLDAGATLGHGFDGNLSACFRFVWFDGAGD